MNENFVRTKREKTKQCNEFYNTLFVQSCICIIIAIIFIFLNTFSKSSYECVKQKYTETMTKQYEVFEVVGDLQKKVVDVFKNMKPLAVVEK